MIRLRNKMLPINPGGHRGRPSISFSTRPDTNQLAKTKERKAPLARNRAALFPQLLYYMALGLLILLLAACDVSGAAPTQPTAAPTEQPVNIFGSSANHVHSMLALPGHVLLLATHYGLFRSQDNGMTWQEVAGGPHQLMDGLMTYSLVQSTLDPQRLYVLTLPALSQHQGTLGLYTSADEGRTWKLAIQTTSITSSSIYLVEPGNDTRTEVYIYLPDLGPLGLRLSLDAGQHFSSTGMLPFGRILGLFALPGAQGQLLAYGSDGMARSVDGGNTWKVLNGIQGGITNVVMAGLHSPIYASGDAGVYSSLDGGKSFKLIYKGASFGSLTVSSANPQVLYGKTGLAVYRSTDGGHIWNTLPHINGNLAYLAADPTNALSTYLSLSYPTAVYHFSQGSNSWQSLTPS